MVMSLRASTLSCEETTGSIFNMEYLDLDLVVVWLTKCVISAYLS